MTLYGKLFQIASKFPNKAAIIFEGEEISYSKFLSGTNCFIDYLKKLKLGIGDRIAWLGLNHYLAIEILFACSAIGAIFVPLNWRLSKSEVDEVLMDCSPALVVYSEGKFRADLNYNEAQFVKLRSGVGISELNYLGYSESEINEKSDALISYTSGSTGKPKGVVLSQEAILCNAKMSTEAHMLKDTDKLLTVLPIFHVGGLNILLTPGLLVGATVLLHEKYDLRKVLRDLPLVNCTIFVPTIFKEVITDKQFMKSDLSRIRTISIGSTIVPIGLIDQALRFGLSLIQLYGSTEITPFAIHQRIKDVGVSLGSIGKAGSLCDIKLFSQTGGKVATGEVGEICVKGKNLFSRYYGKEKVPVFSGGWFKTGDLAVKDSEGNYWFVDRIKNVIISGGENIYPAEIENIALKNSNFTVVAAVAKVDPKWGEVPVLFIEGEYEPDTKILKSEVWESIASYKRPKKIEFLKIFPRNNMGKIKLDDLRLIADGRVV